jgi:hypothetical protein
MWRSYELFGYGVAKLLAQACRIGLVSGSNIGPAISIKGGHLHINPFTGRAKTFSNRAEILRTTYFYLYHKKTPTPPPPQKKKTFAYE